MQFLEALEALETALGWTPRVQALDFSPAQRYENARIASMDTSGPADQRARIADALARLETT